MKVSYKPRPNLLVEFDAAGQKDLFEQMAGLQEILKQDKCGKCGNEDLIFTCRTNDDNKFYELRCRKCGATLGFGSHKTGDTLFPQRKDKEQNWLPDDGWTKWNKETQARE
tara:strand:- start:1139 stop:1471 length:333 start_codon:yes stop_codon:yes gene_type:complete